MLWRPSHIRSPGRANGAGMEVPASCDERLIYTATTNSYTMVYTNAQAIPCDSHNIQHCIYTADRRQPVLKKRRAPGTNGISRLDRRLPVSVRLRSAAEPVCGEYFSHFPDIFLTKRLTQIEAGLEQRPDKHHMLNRRQALVSNGPGLQRRALNCSRP